MYVDYYGKKWYKGNLHTHSNKSDGSQPPELVAARYRHAGYDFLSITDHYIPGMYESISETVETPDYLLLSGAEYAFKCETERSGMKHVGAIHINGVGFTAPPEFKPEFTPQQMVDSIHNKDGIAIYDHPVWSRNLPEDILTAEGYEGVEIFNSATGGPVRDSSVVVDQLAYRGCLLPVMAADDTHGFMGEEFGGFIMVQSENLNRDDIIHAIRERRFYASQGPWVQAKVDGSFVNVECTPVCSISLFSNLPGVMRVTGQRLTWTKFDLSKLWWMPAGAYYFRIEVTDKDGNSAWTNPVLLDTE